MARRTSSLRRTRVRAVSPPDGFAISCEAHGVDRRQRVRHARPAVALVLAHPKAARGRAEGEPFAARIERESMAIHDIVGVRLRQALGEDIEGFAAVARSDRKSTRLNSSHLGISYAVFC